MTSITALEDRSASDSATSQPMQRPYKLLATVATVCALLVGCGSVSKGIDEQGNAEEIVFPDPAKDATRPEGTFPISESLTRLHPGLSKSQVYELIGAPHFNEGFGVREWDYILHLKDAGNSKACQLKLLFNKDALVGSIHWLPQECSVLANLSN